MDKSELFALTARLRRATRQPDVLALCDEVERLATVREPVKVAPKRDRAAYMREYRRRA